MDRIRSLDLRGIAWSLKAGFPSPVCFLLQSAVHYYSIIGVEKKTRGQHWDRVLFLFCFFFFWEIDSLSARELYVCCLATGQFGCCIYFLEAGVLRVKSWCTFTGLYSRGTSMLWSCGFMTNTSRFVNLCTAVRLLTKCENREVPVTHRGIFQSSSGLCVLADLHLSSLSAWHLDTCVEEWARVFDNEHRFLAW